MKLEALEKLHQSMIVQEVDLQQFQVRTGAAEFDCLFSTRETPFVLSLTSRGDRPKFFKFDVNKGYRIVPYFGEMYSDMLKVLKIDGSSGHRLIPGEFLSQLDRRIPTSAQLHRVPDSRTVTRLRHDLEERDRPYFDAWICWTKEHGKSPSEENLRKTAALLGKEARKFSKKMNASSKWSAEPTGRTGSFLKPK